jgi:hypothetical protein
MANDVPGLVRMKVVVQYHDISMLIPIRLSRAAVGDPVVGRCHSCARNGASSRRAAGWGLGATAPIPYRITSRLVGV